FHPSARCFSPSSFFFSYSRHHRDLHSFPTRRSSDLRCAAGCASLWASTATTTATWRWRTRWRRCGPAPRRCRARSTASASAAARSEEHTSELQSLAYLVCRLLLEKKKDKTDGASRS